MNSEELRYIGERFAEETGIPAENSGIGEIVPRTNEAVLSYPVEIITNPAARWPALKDAAAIIAEVHMRAGGINYLSALSDMEKTAGKINTEISKELRRPELPIGECRLHPFYRAGAMIDLANELEQVDTMKISRIREKLNREYRQMETD